MKIGWKQIGKMPIDALKTTCFMCINVCIKATIYNNIYVEKLLKYG